MVVSLLMNTCVIKMRFLQEEDYQKVSFVIEYQWLTNYFFGLSHGDKTLSWQSAWLLLSYFFLFPEGVK